MYMKSVHTHKRTKRNRKYNKAKRGGGMFDFFTGKTEQTEQSTNQNTPIVDQSQKPGLFSGITGELEKLRGTLYDAKNSLTFPPGQMDTKTKAGKLQLTTIIILAISTLSLGYLTLIPPKVTAHMTGIDFINVPLMVALLSIVGASLLAIFRKK